MDFRPAIRFFSCSSRRRLALEFLLYAVLAAVMLHLTWLTWPDAYIDFSRELYLPWRVSCGDVLYRDLAYDFGPVSVYANAVLFVLLGRPSIHALFALNFVFWLATLLALRALLRRIASPCAATLAVASFILLFSFNRYISCGNFNYLAPYSHELARGFLFALLALLSLDSAMRRSSPPLSLSAGVFLGLALFAKPEIALAAFASIAVLFAFHAFFRPSFPLRLLLALILAALATVFLVVMPFAVVLRSFPHALHDTLLKLYLDCFNPALSSLPFYRHILGIDDIPSGALRIVLGTLSGLLPFLAARILLPRLRLRPLRIAVIAVSAAIAAIIGFHAFFLLNGALAMVPVFFLFGECGHPVREARPPSSGGACSGRRRPLAIAFSAFSFLLVSKMLLNAVIGFYGFVLVLPAFCCAVLFLFRSPCPASRAILASALLIGFSAAAFRLQASTFRTWDIRHSIHDGTCFADPLDARSFNAVLDWIRTNTPPGSSLAVLPEGAILNVLSGRPNPTPYVYLSQGDWLRFGPSAVLAAYSNALPDTLVLVRKPQDADFGTDYARDLMDFLAPLYSPAFTVSGPASSAGSPYLIVARKN